MSSLYNDFASRAHQAQMNCCMDICDALQPQHAGRVLEPNVDYEPGACNCKYRNRDEPGYLDDYGNIQYQYNYVSSIEFSHHSDYETCTENKEKEENAKIAIEEDEECCTNLCTSHYQQDQDPNTNFGDSRVIDDPNFNPATDNWMTKRLCQCAPQGVIHIFETIGGDIQEKFDECEKPSRERFLARNAEITIRSKKEKCCRTSCEDIAFKSRLEDNSGQVPHQGAWFELQGNDCHCIKSYQQKVNIETAPPMNGNIKTRDILAHEDYNQCVSGTSHPTPSPAASPEVAQKINNEHYKASQGVVKKAVRQFFDELADLFK